MPVFDKVKEYILGKPDRKREELCTVLMSYGADARLAERKCPEEKIGSNLGRRISLFYWVSGGNSLGTINITKGLIRWVNVLQYQWEDSPTEYSYVYGIPDYRIQADFPELHVKSVGVRKSWFGEVVGIRWHGFEYGLGIVERLSKPSITKVILESDKNGIDANIEIHTCPSNTCWIILAKTIPTLMLWDCYQSIADELLAIPDFSTK